ncbi:class II fumarate hydratase [Methanosalsum natronophilum]|uniref:Aspartate ammonia-lyase n=1 Tax=Methanosalsum natronophilum TaxID=768733 RepID=A0A424YSM3_9EURY|nr:aspartate ammonia-lyase [Methanosalsum natronophilum]MCS3923669.1 fumarate hydratase class II/aspartate ammonia-lyase [Methanosalsum natronophilum]RQD81772.1 MAG: aspartate ammonia-lyase [Methanosalsum natronophilum]
MVRIEKDSLGEVRVPSNVYYGPQTVRATQNFPISGDTLPHSFIKAQAAIKLAAAKANRECGVLLDPLITKSIIDSALEIRSGKYLDQFVVDVFQAGAGTSQNMNMNEVIANLALERMGFDKGRYDIIHPNDHINMSQSSNDTIHSAMHVSIVELTHLKLLPVIDEMLTILDEIISENNTIVKPGRTHLQEAVPITLGQEFSGYFRSIELAKNRIESALTDLLELNLGGSAVGTGINVPRGFSSIALKEIRLITGHEFRLTKNRFEATQTAGSALTFSAALRGLAVELIKISNDIRLLASDPRTSIGELSLKAVQPGSSIMPGKVNPAMPEMMNMVCFQVIGNDGATVVASQAGQLELNVFTPIITHNILRSLEILSNAIKVFNINCLRGLKANSKRCEELMNNSLSIATVLAPKLGYDRVAEIVQKANRENKSIKSIVMELGIMSEDELDDSLDPLKVTRSMNDTT